MTAHYENYRKEPEADEAAPDVFVLRLTASEKQLISKALEFIAYRRLVPNESVSPILKKLREVNCFDKVPSEDRVLMRCPKCGFITAQEEFEIELAQDINLSRAMCPKCETWHIIDDCDVYYPKKNDPPLPMVLTDVEVEGWERTEAEIEEPILPVGADVVIPFFLDKLHFQVLPHGFEFLDGLFLGEELPPDEDILP